MRVLVTGPSGFIGRRFVELAPAEHEVVAVCREGGGAPEGVEAVTADLTEPGFAAGLPADVDAVVHLAQSRRDRDFPEGGDDMVAVNVAAAERLLDYARRADARFLLASTATVYAQSPDPLREDAALDCSSLYAASKRSAELLAGPYAQQIPVRVARIFTPYGPGQRGRLIAKLVERVRAGDPVQVRGERGLLLSPIHVNDVAHGLHGLLAAAAPPVPGPELVNLAGGEVLGIREIAEAIGAALGIEPRFEPAEADGEADPGGLVADTAKLASLLPDFTPINFADGVRELVAAPDLTR